MTATKDGGDFILNGEKTWISNGGIADLYTVFARTGEAPGARGLSAFLVTPDMPGFEVAERLQVIAPHPLARLRFNDVRVPAANMIGAPGQGFKVAMAVLETSDLKQAPIKLQDDILLAGLEMNSLLG